MDLPSFTRLPLELQIEVWQHALLADSKERLVPLHGRHVVPHRGLASPFLAVNAVSRAEARRFYTVAVPVRDLPLFDAAAPCFAWRRAARVRDAGVVYLDPVRDMFVTGLDFAPQFAEKPLTPQQVHDENDGSGDAEEEVKIFTVRPITEALPAQTCREIQNVVLAGWDATGEYQRETEVVEYSKRVAERLWNRSIFSGSRTWRHLWMGKRHDKQKDPCPLYRLVAGEKLSKEASCARVLMLLLKQQEKGEDGEQRGRLGSAIETWTVMERRDGGARRWRTGRMTWTILKGKGCRWQDL
ncbi:hypothetical protein PG993_011404 [Apiospora rasikravindrae]|uniref:2EXR domain-containing protein n=1 Tax=Apiospora rasikravindrae TaxID=990691 RepID=A0ABR1SE58_9PEZI